jgi:hypothetical protein
MNTILSKYFDSWLAEKEKYNLIQEVYGISGLMAVANFIDYIKYQENLKYPGKEILNGNFNGSCNRRN